MFMSFFNLNFGFLMDISDTLRNDLFLTLVKGEFEKGAKTASKNIEVRVIVVDKFGKELQVSSLDSCFLHRCICINITTFPNHFVCLLTCFPSDILCIKDWQTVRNVLKKGNVQETELAHNSVSLFFHSFIHT